MKRNELFLTKIARIHAFTSDLYPSYMIYIPKWKIKLSILEIIL